MGKQVKTPRFYVDIPTFLHATGQLDWDLSKGGAELLYMNCSNPVMREQGTTNSMFIIGGQQNNVAKTSFPINFCALLNHNLASDTLLPQIKGYDTTIGSEVNLTHNDNFEAIILNAERSGNKLEPTYNGTSIWQVGTGDRLNPTPINATWNEFKALYTGGYTDTINHQLGSLVVGKYFDCPNSPDLNLTMSRRFDGIKKQKTIGGKTLANIYYDGPTEWTMNNADGTTYKYPPFELDTTDNAEFDQRVKSGIGRKGLRSWNLTFSYIAESDMWIDNEVSNNIISDSEDPDPTSPTPIFSDDSFNFVWNCTLGGTLPFIFQPDADKRVGNNMVDGNNNPDQFAICNFRENTFSVQQVAFNTYSVSMTIDELA
jgi:hypothetical protein